MKKKCFGCKWLCMNKDDCGKEDLFFGKCICEFNKIKNRDRCVTDKACKCKNYNQTKGE